MPESQEQSGATDDSHEPGGSPLAPGVADERFAANVRVRREANRMSQADLAREMAQRGWRYHPQTVHRIETGSRKVSVGEAEALARVLRTSMDRMTWPDPVENVVAFLDMFIGRAESAFDQIASWTASLLFARAHVEDGIAGAERQGLQDQEQVRVSVGEGRAVLLNTTPERAVEMGKADYAEGRAGEDEVPGEPGEGVQPRGAG